MAARQLIFRLAGITALCLAALLVPVAAVDRIVILTALSLGIGFASVMPGYDRAATRVVGPAVLVLALIPPNGLWILVAVVALFTVGFAAFNRHGMSRVVPALGLPIAAVAFRAGETVDALLLLAWVATVVFTLAMATIAWPTEPGRPLSPTPSLSDGPVVYRSWRLVQALMVAVAVVPIALWGAATIDTRLPSFVLAQPRFGEINGPRLQAHPGLTGGLDTGSPVSLSDDVVLRVKADRPLYWRGTTYENWDGRRWTSEVDTTPLSWSGDGVRLPTLPGADRASMASGARANDLPEPVTVLQQFTAERAGLDVVLGAWRVESLWSSAKTADLGDDGSLRLDEPLGAGATWTVESALVPASAEDMRRADPNLLDPSSATLARYAVEDDVHPEVAALAREITASAPSTYDKVLALEAWMDENILYTRDIPRLAEGEDAVHHLMFESRRGYCEQIGSALVVMLRSLGVPARLVVGYVPGSYDATSGEWLSRGTDAHAWAEVYFPGVGWTGFDPTAGVPAAPGDASQPSSLGISAGATTVVSALALAALVAGVIYANRHRLSAVLARRRQPEVPGHVRSMRLLYERFEACGEQLGIEWPASATLREKGHALEAAGVDPARVLAARSELERLFYDDRADHDQPDFQQTLVRAELGLGELESAVAALCVEPQVAGV